MLLCVQALIAYFFGKELKDSGTGLVASALMAVVPGADKEKGGGGVGVCVSPPPRGGEDRGAWEGETGSWPGRGDQGGLVASALMAVVPGDNGGGGGGWQGLCQHTAYVCR